MKYFVAFGIFVVILIILVNIAKVQSAEEICITVQEKERVVTSSGNNVTSKYLIFSKEGEVFENTDSFLFLKFNSSDIYGQLKSNQKYLVKVAGWRIQWSSQYRNIIEVLGECK